MLVIAFWIPLSLTLMLMLTDLSELAVLNSDDSAALIFLICADDWSLTTSVACSTKLAIAHFGLPPARMILFLISWL